MKRDTAQTIFRTVVFAGAMLGAPACAKKTPPPSAPANTAPTAADPQQPGENTADPCAVVSDPCSGGDEDPCAGGERPRGVDDDGGGGAGRGFILS